jgi:signal transduction histidine kinase
MKGSSRTMHPIVRDEVYRIGYEAIRNACLHSEASRVGVELDYQNDLIVRVRDDGKGMEPYVARSGKAGHFGVVGMNERAARVGGKLTITSSAEAGTLVELAIPRSLAFQQ